MQLHRPSEAILTFPNASKWVPAVMLWAGLGLSIIPVSEMSTNGASIPKAIALGVCATISAVGGEAYAAIQVGEHFDIDSEFFE